MLKQRLQQKLLQKLSPQQIQMIKLLEIPTMQLEQRIKREMEDNPILEDAGIEDRDNDLQDEDVSSDPNDKDKDEFTLEDYMEEDEIPSYRLSTGNYSGDERREEIPFSVGSTYHDYLETQLGLRTLDEKQHTLALYIIGNIDDDGYLRRKLDNIIDDVAFALNIETTEEELLDILRIIQDFEPVGTGARNLQECLLLQIRSKDQSGPDVELAHKILKDFFQEFTRKHYDKILSRLNITDEDLKGALDEILKLNPKPGSAYSDPQNKDTAHIVPDFILENDEGDLRLSLNAKNVPELRISKTYSDMLHNFHHGYGNHSKKQKEALSFVKQKLDSARWFIDAIKQRQNTLMVTMNAIINYQREYFMEGEETRLRPMILKDIADETGLDISTISRVANSKYIQTNFGIFPLKYFFSEGMQTESGEEVSTREIKKILQDCISYEDKRRPLTDEKLAEILKEKGYHIARRTIAKYREQLNIPVARMRKELK
ncbi:MAG: RNA polymerase factor sigma-54 [Bacteroidales bacterium]|nr:RNA polymerase factor sigma-54 [Bacteroidales bacterium]MBN2762395.1 RNA polymerase factor sigma-54 [Bacteroidales bacterium]